MADEPLSRVEEILEGGSPPLLSRIEKLLKEGGAGGGVSPEQIAAAVAAYLDEHGAVIDVDSELSTTSEKPVQNKVIAAALQEHDVFIAENGVTTNAEIYAAFQAGKVVICVHNDDEYYLSECKANSARFVCPVKSTGYVLSFRVSDNVWHADTPTRFAKTNDLSGYYTKPSGGIPASDLASAVQTSLGKAETALQTAPVASVNGMTGDVVITVDSALSTTSENPVQNKVVKAALDAKADASALAAKQDALTAGQNITISGNTISAYADSAEIAADVTDWLDNNVTPVGSAVVVDSSLSVSGAAADAKATGDAIAKIYEDVGVNEPTPTPEVVVQPTGSVQGFVTADGKFASASSTKTFYFLGEPNTVYRMHVNNSVQDGVSQYIAEYPSIPSIGNVSANYDRIDGREDVSITTGDTAGYICFGHGYEGTNTNMTVYAQTQSVESKTLGERVAGLEESNNEIQTTLYGGASLDTLYIADENFSRYASTTRSSSVAKPVVGQNINISSAESADVYYFPVSGVRSVTFPKINTTEGVGHAFVSSDGTVIEAFVYNNVQSREYTTVQVPTSATYFVVTWWKVWLTDYDLGIYLYGETGGSEEGLVDRVNDIVDRVEVLESQSGSAVSALCNVRPVSTPTVNAMMKCAYTYIDACRSGALVYGDGTGTSQRAGTICCSTFMRQLLQGIPYNDYLPARADGTTKSGQRWRYGYRMLGDDYFEHDSTYTALQMYNKYQSDGRAFPCDYNMAGAEPGDLIVFGADVSSINHIGMFVYRDVMGKPYIMDATPRNGNLAIRIHEARDHTIADVTNPVGIIRPNLSDVYFEPPFETAQISDSAWSFAGENGFGYFVDLDYSVAANALVTLNSENSFTPNYSGKDHRVLLIPATADGTLSGTFSGISGVVGKVSKFII